MYNDFVLIEASTLTSVTVSVKKYLDSFNTNITKFNQNPTHETYSNIILKSIKNLDNNLFKYSKINKSRLLSLCKYFSLQKESYSLTEKDKEETNNKLESEDKKDKLQTIKSSIREKLTVVSSKISAVISDLQDKSKISKLDEFIQSKIDTLLFKNKDGSEKALYKFRYIITSLLAVFVISFSLALMNVGVKLAGENLNQVKSLNDFIKMIYRCAMKNVLSFFIITLSFILFITSTFFLFIRIINFILNKIKALFEYLSRTLPEKVVTQQQVIDYQK